MLEKMAEMQKFKNTYFLFCVYKMVEITKETWKRNGVEVIVFKGEKWLNKANIKDLIKH